MIFAWEAALCADRSGIEREKIRYKPSLGGSPYSEVIMENLNESTLRQSTVELNPLYRFSTVFSEMFDRNLQEFSKSREVFFDIYMQYMIQQDLRQRLSRKEYQLKYILADLLADVCQINSEAVVYQLDREKIPLLLRSVWKLYCCGSNMILFREIMRAMFPSSIIYEHRETPNQLLVYVGEKETDEKRRQMDFLQALFLPLNKQVFLFWEHHFGIIGIDETMVLDEMVLF